MQRQNGRGPPLRRAGSDPQIEQPAKALTNEVNADAAHPQDAPPTAVDDISPIAFGPEDLLGTVVNMAGWGASHLRSARESAWRGDVEQLGDHLRQASNALKAAQMTYAVIADEKAKAASDDELAPA